MAHTLQIFVEEDGSRHQPFLSPVPTIHEQYITSSVYTPIQPIEVLVKRFSYVHIDIVGPLPAASSGFLHLFTIVDRSTRWTEAIPFKSTSTGDCAEAFFTGWISRLVVPSKDTSNRGVQFTSAA